MKNKITNSVLKGTSVILEKSKEIVQSSLNYS